MTKRNTDFDMTERVYAFIREWIKEHTPIHPPSPKSRRASTCRALVFIATWASWKGRARSGAMKNARGESACSRRNMIKAAHMGGR